MTSEGSKASVIELALNGKACKALVDTGATICVISERLYKSTGSAQVHKLCNSNHKNIVGVGGKKVQVLGKVELPLKVAALSIHQEFLVIPGANSPELILGENFLADQKACINYATGTVSLQEGLVQTRLLPVSTLKTRACFVRTVDDIVLGGRSELIVPVKVSVKRNARTENVNAGVIEPVSTLPTHWKVAGARCAVAPTKTKCSYRLLNPYSTDTIIPKNTIVGVYSPLDNDEIRLVHNTDLPCDVKLTNTLTSYLPEGDMSDSPVPSPSQETSVDTDTPFRSNLDPNSAEFIPRANVIDTHVPCCTKTDSDSLGAYLEKLHDYASVQNGNNYQETVLVTDTATDTKDFTEIGKSLGVNVSKELSHSEQGQLYELVGKNRDVFATNMSELGCYPNYKHVIDTGDAPSVKSRFYRVSPDQKREIERQIKEMLDCGIVSRSTSDWLSPVLLVKKSSNQWRLVVDYRGLNRLVKPIYFPLPRHQDVTDALGESDAAIFSTLDLAQAFFQTELDPATKHRSAFICHEGVYEFNRTPFGLSNSPATFGIVMSQVLRDFLYVYALVYADDILVYSKDLPTHLKHLQTIFDQLRTANLTLKPTKCTLGCSKVRFIGHIFSKAGVAVDKEKTKAIETFPTPTNVSQIKSFLGVCQYYRKFCKSFSHICSPLTALLQKGAKFVWDSQCQASFDKLKQMLTSSPVLAYPCFDKEFTLYTDASCTAISYILGQRDDKGREVVIEYGGRSLRNSERRWPITELEGLAMIEGIRYYHIYLQDRPFTLVTDHAALQYIQNTKASTGRLSRWALFLQQYRMNVQYKKGKLHTNADGLSRREYSPTTSDPSSWVYTGETTTRHEDLSPSVSLIQIPNPEKILNEKEKAENHYTQVNAVRHIETVMAANDLSVKDQQRADPKLAPIIAYLTQKQLPENLTDKQLTLFIAESHEFVVDSDDDLLYHLYYPRGKGLRADRLVKQLVVPETLKHEILLSYHDSLLVGHGGFDRTYHLIRLKYYWAQMYNQIKLYVKSCQECQQNKRESHPNAPLRPLPCEGLFKRVHVDLYGPLPAVDGYKYVLLIVDAFTKWTEAFPIKTLKGEEIAKVFYREFICRWGAPYALLSDRGTNFLSTVVKEVCKLFQITKYKTSSWHPQTNATAERRMSMLGQTLRIFSNKHQTNWPDLLPSVMAGWRATPSTNSTLFSPYRLIVGEEMRLPIDVDLLPNKSTSPDVFRHLQDLAAEFTVTREMAKENIKRAQAQQKEYHDRKAVQPTYKLGDRVWLTNVNKKKGLNPKLQEKYQGPYYIADVSDNNTYELRHCETHNPLKSRINAQRIKPYVPETIRDIQTNELARDPNSQPDMDELDDVIAQDTGPLTDPQTNAQPDPQDPVSKPSQNANTPVNPSPSQVDPVPSQTDVQPPSQSRIVECLKRCQSYRGKKWYLTKWVNHKFCSWVIEDNLPEDKIRTFHIEKTQTGKARKGPKRKARRR